MLSNQILKGMLYFKMLGLYTKWNNIAKERNHKLSYKIILNKRVNSPQKTLKQT